MKLVSQFARIVCSERVLMRRSCARTHVRAKTRQAEFRHSLQALGVNKMGHRERILAAVKALPANNY